MKTLPAKSNSELVERLRKYSDPVHVEEFYMKRWDKIRGYIAEGHKGSWPRDVFESLIDGWAQDAMEAASALEHLAGEVERLREALGRMAKLCLACGGTGRNKYFDQDGHHESECEDCKEARAALAETPAGLDRQGPHTDAG